MEKSCRFLVVVVFALLVVGECGNATGILFGWSPGRARTSDPVDNISCDATVSIHDQRAVTYIDQRFFNSTSASIVALYVVPLPKGAFITQFAFWVNGLKYSASIREQHAGQKYYDEDVSPEIQLVVSAQLGENTFKLRIARIDPQTEIRFEFNYSELLPASNGLVNYRLPLRTTGFGFVDLDRVSVAIDVVTDQSLTSLAVTSHGNTTIQDSTRIDSSHYRLTFTGNRYKPDTDLAFSFSRRHDPLGCHAISFVPNPDDSLGSDGYYGLWVTTPEEYPSPVRLNPRNIVFAVDISARMTGERLIGIMNALNTFLDELQPGDRFNIVAFHADVMSYASDLVDVTHEEIVKARTFVSGLRPAKTSNIDAALARSLGMTYQDHTEKIVMVLTGGLPTAGETSGMMIVDSAVARNRSHVHIFTFGIGEIGSMATFLTDLAAYNDGFFTHIPSGESITEGVRKYFQRLVEDDRTGATIEVEGLSSFDRYPDRFPDAGPGKQLVQFGRYNPPGGERRVRLRGEEPDVPFEEEGTAWFNDTPGLNHELARFWAKQKIDFLLDDITRYGEHKELVDAVIRLGLRYSILTRYTTVSDNPGLLSGVEDQVNVRPLRMLLR